MMLWKFSTDRTTYSQNLIDQGPPSCRRSHSIIWGYLILARTGKCRLRGGRREQAARRACRDFADGLRIPLVVQLRRHAWEACSSTIVGSEVPGGYRDAQEAASSVPAHGSLVQSALSDAGEAFVIARGRARRSLPTDVRWQQPRSADRGDRSRITLQ